MSVFLLPKTLCKEINSMMSKFCWGSKEKESNIAWMSCEHKDRAKYKGGLGFHDLENFNLEGGH
jgi:hypothetical protein